MNVRFDSNGVQLAYAASLVGFEDFTWYEAPAGFDHLSEVCTRDTQTGDITKAAKPAINRSLNPKEAIKLTYEKYELDGKAFFEDMRADLVILYQTQNKTAAEIFEIETKLQPVTEKVLLGDWMTAQDCLLNTVVVGGALEQTLYDQIKDFIADYITNNYPS